MGLFPAPLFAHFFFFSSEHEVSLCQRIRSQMTWTAQFTARCKHNVYLRRAVFSRSVKAWRKSSVHFMEAKNMHKWFTDSISLQVMLMDSSLALTWILFLPISSPLL